MGICVIVLPTVACLGREEMKTASMNMRPDAATFRRVFLSEPSEAGHLWQQRSNDSRFNFGNS